MFDIGWSEMAVIALLALIVIGPRDLPRVMRTVGHWVRKARSVASDFQSSLDDMVRESELDEARKSIESTRRFDVGSEVERTIDPTGEVGDEARELETTARRGAEEGEPDSGRRRKDVGSKAEAGKETETVAESGPAAERAGAESADERRPELAEAGESEADAHVTPYRMAPPHSVQPPRDDDGDEAKEDRGKAEETSEESVSDGADGSKRRA